MSVQVTLRKIKENWNPAKGKPVPREITEDLFGRNKCTSDTFVDHLAFLSAILPDCYTPGRCENSAVVITQLSPAMVNGLLAANRKSRNDPASPVPGFTRNFINGLRQNTACTCSDGTTALFRESMFQKIFSFVSANKIPSSKAHGVFVNNDLTQYADDTAAEARSEFEKVHAAIDRLLDTPTDTTISYAIFLLIVCAIVQDRIGEVSFLYAPASLDKVNEHQYGRELIKTPSFNHGVFYDEYYFDHTYHVYKFRDHTGELWKECTFRMERKSNGLSIATLKFRDDTLSPITRNCKLERTYTGTPMLSPVDKMIYIAMSDEKDSFLLMAIPYHRFKFAPMYFRTGFIVKSDPELGVPKTKKIAITAKPLPGGDLIYMKGLLKLDNNQLYLSERQLRTFLRKFRNYPWMKDFRDNYLPIFKAHRKKSGLFHFNSDEILSCSMSNLEHGDRLRILLALKSIDSSNNPNLYKSVVCEDPKGTHHIFKYGSKDDTDHNDSL